MCVLLLVVAISRPIPHRMHRMCYACCHRCGDVNLLRHAHLVRSAHDYAVGDLRARGVVNVERPLRARY